MPVLLIAGLALLIMMPEILTGVTITDSYRYNILWPEQFTRLFAAGALYPRWLPDSWAGLGAPVFYFYPPLFFWVTALIHWLAAGSISIAAATSLASAMGLGASGWSMRLWLSEMMPGQRATLGAIAYMLAPYHLYDLYGRGALAEAYGYVWLPLILYALRKTVEQRWRGIPLLAVSYALLLFSHLPFAILASLTAIPAYAIFLIRNERVKDHKGLLASIRPRSFFPPLAGVLLGIALAAIYVLPALLLFPHINAGALNGPDYSPWNWFFWRPSAWPIPLRMWIIIPLTAGAALLAGALLRRRQGDGCGRESCFWGIVVLGCVVLVSGAVPWLWDIPLLAQIQFPWRGLAIIELAVIAGIALNPPEIRRIPVLFGGLLVAFTASSIAMIIVQRAVVTHQESGAARTKIFAEKRDALEYLPQGIEAAYGQQRLAQASREPMLPALFDIRSTIALSTAALHRLPGDEARLVIDAPVNARITLRRFYFPIWQMVDMSGAAIATKAEPGSDLLTFEVRKGRHIYYLRMQRHWAERIGAAISGLALMAILGLLCVTRRDAASRSRVAS